MGFRGFGVEGLGVLEFCGLGFFLNPRGFFAQQHPDWLRDGNTTHATIVMDSPPDPHTHVQRSFHERVPSKGLSLAVAVRKYHAFETGSHPKQHVPQPATLPKNPNLP